MKKRLIAALLVVMCSGCSIHKALTGPPPVEVEKVKIGASRIDVINTLGVPRTSEVMQGTRTDLYEFVDGYSGASKSRVILYIAGDLFTCGLSELLFWPIELVADGGTRGRAVVKYGMDDIAKSVLLTQADGSPWEVTEVVAQPQQVKSGALAIIN